MAGRLHLDWHHTAQEFERRYRTERDPFLIPRWHAFWLIRHGHSVAETATLLDRAESTLWVWMKWYRDGGIEDLGGHPRGHRQMPEPLSPEDQARLVAEANRGTFVTQAQAIAWLAETGGPTLSRNQMHRQFQILDLRKKMPRPRSTKADPEAQEAFNKGGSPH